MSTRCFFGFHNWSFTGGENSAGNPGTYWICLRCQKRGGDRWFGRPDGREST